MFIHKDRITGADTKTKLRTKKVIDWDATLGTWFFVVIVIVAVRYVFLS